MPRLMYRNARSECVTGQPRKPVWSLSHPQSRFAITVAEAHAKLALFRRTGKPSAHQMRSGPGDVGILIRDYSDRRYRSTDYCHSRLSRDLRIPGPLPQDSGSCTQNYQSRTSLAKRGFDVELLSQSAAGGWDVVVVTGCLCCDRS